MVDAATGGEAKNSGSSGRSSIHPCRQCSPYFLFTPHVDARQPDPQNPPVAERRFLVLVFSGIALLACVTWVHLRLTERDAARSAKPFSLDDLAISPPPAPPSKSADPDRAAAQAAARTRLMARVNQWATELDDSAAVARANLRTGSLQSDLHGRSNLQSGRLTQAVDDFDRALKANPSNLNAYRGRAAALARAGRMPEALHAYDDLVHRSPDTATDRFNYAVCLARMDRLSDAAEQLNRALELEPNFDRAVYNLAVITQQQGKLSETVALWQRFCNRQPSVASAWFNLAAAFTDLARFDDALESFQTAAKLQPDDPITLYNLAVTLRALGRDAEAESPLAAAVRIDPQDDTAAAELLDLHRRLAERGTDADRHTAAARRLEHRLAERNASQSDDATP